MPHHIPTLQSNNSTLYTRVLSAEQLADILGIHTIITLLILSVIYVGNRLRLHH